jgi:hypothetical protein
MPHDWTQATDPLALFLAWFEDAKASEPADPEAMSLATVDAAGLPDVRMVLCKLADEHGITFYTNAESASGSVACVQSCGMGGGLPRERRQAKILLQACGFGRPSPNMAGDSRGPR